MYSLFLGPQKVVVVNGLQALKEALVTRAADFSGRPQGLLLNDATQRTGTAAALANPDPNPRGGDGGADGKGGRTHSRREGRLCQYTAQLEIRQRIWQGEDQGGRGSIEFILFV